MSDYNYDIFDLAREEPAFQAFPERLKVGDRAPNTVVEDLATGESTSIRHLASSGVAVLEFGSFT